MLVAQVLVCDVVLGADQHPAGTVVTARHRDQEVGVLLQRLRVLPHHVVQTQIELVECERLLGLLSRLASGVRVGVLWRTVV